MLASTAPPLGVFSQREEEGDNEEPRDRLLLRGERENIEGGGYAGEQGPSAPVREQHVDRRKKKEGRQQRRARADPENGRCVDARDGEEGRRRRGEPRALEKLQGEMKDEEHAEEMEDEVEGVVHRDIAGRRLLHAPEREVHERPEEVDDPEGEEVSRRHVVPGGPEPGEVVVEEPVVEDAAIGGEREEQKKHIDRAPRHGLRRREPAFVGFWSGPGIPPRSAFTLKAHFSPSQALFIVEIFGENDYHVPGTIVER